VNLDGKIVTPVALLIESRGLPIIFATGYGAAGLTEEFKSRPALQKPFVFAALAAALLRFGRIPASRRRTKRMSRRP
jgi:hypothetical protein